MRKLIFAALVRATALPPRPWPRTPPFTGVRVEGIAGWDRSQANGGHNDGVAYGVGAGFDFQAGRAVLGVEGEASDATTDSASSDRRPRRPHLREAGRDLYVGGRIGALVGTGHPSLREGRLHQRPGQSDL